jgi:hypothetical protein
LERIGFLFPANDYAIDVIWATNLLSYDPATIDKKFPLLKNFIATEPCDDIADIAVPLESMLYYSASLLSLVLFDPAITREQIWQKPTKVGEELERATATTLWLRYKAKQFETNGVVYLSSLIANCPTELSKGNIASLYFLIC